MGSVDSSPDPSLRDMSPATTSTTAPAASAILRRETMHSVMHKLSRSITEALLYTKAFSVGLSNVHFDSLGLPRLIDGA